jgi:hypothetical protein
MEIDRENLGESKVEQTRINRAGTASIKLSPQAPPCGGATKASGAVEAGDGGDPVSESGRTSGSASLMRDGSGVVVGAEGGPNGQPLEGARGSGEMVGKGLNGATCDCSNTGQAARAQFFTEKENEERRSERVEFPENQASGGLSANGREPDGAAPMAQPQAENREEREGHNEVESPNEPCNKEAVAAGATPAATSLSAECPEKLTENPLHPTQRERASEESTAIPPHPTLSQRERATENSPEGLFGDAAADTSRRWKELLEAWEELKAQGVSRAEAARDLGVGVVTLWRVEKQYAKKGFESGIDNRGRASDWEHILANKPFLAKLLELYTATVGASGGNVLRARRTAKMATALTCMAEEAECPAELGSRLKRGKFPVCLLRYLKRVTPEIENRLRGPKHFQLNGIVSRRDLTVRFPDGTRGELPAGFKWVFDDMSVNQPFWVQMMSHGRDGNDATNIMFSRQGLYCIDHRSLRWLGKMLVARPREAYRAEDILRFLRELFKIYGKPDLIVFERSVWASLKIKGYKISAMGCVEEEDVERPEMNEAERENLQRGLQGIGVKLIFATSAHGKIIEVAFNHLQNVIAIKARQYVNIGRHAGEFECGAKRLRQVRAGSHQPGALGFATMEEISNCVDEAFASINGTQNTRGEVPDEVWSADCGVRNADGTWARVGRRPLRDLQPQDYAAFLPDVRERTIEGGKITVKVDGRWLDFRAPWMIELGSGYKVYLKFDSSEPTLGAAVYNRQGGPTNVNGWKLGHFIGWAVWEMPGPSVDVIGQVRGVEAKSVAEFYGAGAFDNGDNLRKGQSKVVATAFSAMPRPGQPAVKRSEARDGNGNVVKIERGDHLTPNPSPHAERGTNGARRGILTPPTRDEVTKRRDRLSRQAALANTLMSLQGEP